ncbi:hypothetical protein SprV_0802516700 [Sparganum proliferum]
MIKRDDGVELDKDDEKAEHLSRFFQSVFTRDVAVPADHYNVNDVPTIDSVVLTKAIVQQEVLKLKEAKSPGPDEIPAKLLKELATELAEPLCLLFQASLDEGRLPPEWKTVWTSPIHKSGSRASANNYRPVSLTSICCKVMERIIKRELMRFLEQHHLLSNAQHGYRRGRSCLTNLLYCLDQWTRWIDEGNVVHVAYIDFKKAFDSVPHQLLYKLSRIGVRGKLLKWIENFLIGRSQTARLGGQQSTEVTVTSGVPQGSVLGPILFLIYIDDCIHGLDCDIAMFADDIKLWTVIRNEDDEAKLQANSDRLEQWILNSVSFCHWGGNIFYFQDIYLDDLHLPCNNESCKSTVNESIEVEYYQTNDGRHYEVEGQICKPQNYFRIGWQVEGFNRSGRKTLLTQFIAPRDDWSVNNNTCIQPQYSLPLIRTINDSSQTTVKCAIRKSLCNKNDGDIYLDDLHLPCNNESCKSTVNESIEVEYYQTNDGRHYEVEGQICKPQNYFRIGWQVEGFNRSGRKTLLTQFIAPRDDWSVNNNTCIQPQYSLPLIRTINDSSQTTVKCAIRKSLCNKNDGDIYLDDLHLPCNNESCKSTVNESIEVEYYQTNDGRHYEVEGQICKPQNYFRIGWQVEGFNRSGRKTLLTQFIAPRDDWSVNNNTCIQPQYSLPLIRTINDSSQTTVKCAIRKSLCNKNDGKIVLDRRSLSCEDGWCRARGDDDMQVEYQQERGFAHETYQHLSNGFEDNVVTSLDSCQWVRVRLPERLTDIYLDDLHLSCNNKSCKSTVNESIEVEYYQTNGWQVEGFNRSGRKTLLTQFIAPRDDWSVNNNTCIQPQYSLPLIRTINDSSQTTVKCAIRKSLCNKNDGLAFSIITWDAEYEIIGGENC